jgi:SAM-dependent methyltransferase
MAQLPSSAERTYTTDFAAYYDVITAHKDYTAEAEALTRVIAAHCAAPAPRLLDVGCGTGTHAALLAERGFDITAIDAAPEMARRAEDKAPQLTVAVGEIAALDAGEFDFAYSLFNVINCLDSLEAMFDFLHEIGSRVARGGGVVVEAWNPIAVVALPPEKVVREYATGGARITRTVVPRPDFLRQRLDLDYTVVVEEKGKCAKEFFVTHNLVLFTPLEIELGLRQAGFGQIGVRTALPDLSHATAEDRMLAFTAVKLDAPA